MTCSLASHVLSLLLHENRFPPASVSTNVIISFIISVAPRLSLCVVTTCQPSTACCVTHIEADDRSLTAACRYVTGTFSIWSLQEGQQQRPVGVFFKFRKFPNSPNISTKVKKNYGCQMVTHPYFFRGPGLLNFSNLTIHSHCLHACIAQMLGIAWMGEQWTFTFFPQRNNRAP